MISGPDGPKQNRPFEERPYYTSAGFGARLAEGQAPVFHGFFGRLGGVSTGLYAALNCGVGTEDLLEHVMENRRIVAEFTGVAPARLLSLYQIHSAVCLPVTEEWRMENRPQADAMVTDRAGLALGILTADCAPVLFYGEKPDGAPVIGAAHAGWGGALNGVLEATVREMMALGAVGGRLSAAIGPCIGQASYEVTDDFRAPFLAQDPESERFFMAGRRAGHVMFDLAGYCAFRLARAGVRDVCIKDLDTYFHEEDFFSYRRTTHRKEPDYGRQIAVVAIR